MPGIELEDVMAGISICRNPDLANVFYWLHLIEAYGTGISKIIGLTLMWQKNLLLRRREILLK